MTGAHELNLINNYFRTSAQGIRQPGWFPDSSIRIRMHKIPVTDDDGYTNLEEFLYQVDL